MYTLYWEHLSGAIAPHALLEELGAPYRLVHVDMDAGAHRSPDYLALNPAARVPALTLPDGTTIGETAAIILALGEAYPGTPLVPAPGEADRAPFLFWLMAMATGGYPTFSRAWHPEQFTADDSSNATVAAVGEADLVRFFDMLDANIAGTPWFLPRGFTALDLYVAMLSEWMADRPALFARNPQVGALCRAVSARASYAGVMRRHAAAPEAAAQGG